MFPGGVGIEVYTDRVAESILTLYDEDSNEFIMFGEILDHRYNDKAIQNKYSCIHWTNRAPDKQKHTKGWHLLIQWVDGTNIWERLADLKESYPTKIADYAKGNNLLNKT